MAINPDALRTLLRERPCEEVRAEPPAAAGLFRQPAGFFGCPARGGSPNSP